MGILQRKPPHRNQRRECKISKIECEHTLFMEHLYGLLIRSNLADFEIKWIVDQTYYRIHDGQNYCTCIENKKLVEEDMTKQYTAILNAKTSKLDKGKMMDGKFVKEGTKMVNGVRCPQCGAFYPGANNVHICGNCGFKNPKKMKPYELKKYIKNLRRQKVEENRKLLDLKNFKEVSRKEYIEYAEKWKVVGLFRLTLDNIPHLYGTHNNKPDGTMLLRVVDEDGTKENLKYYIKEDYSGKGSEGEETVENKIETGEQRPEKINETEKAKGE
jgi:ribosomal protein L37E